MKAPFPKTTFPNNPYQPAWFERDFFHSPDGVGEFPQHHCNQTFNISLPFVKKFRNAVDVGCRDGEYARYLQHYFSHTYCFDPRAMMNFCYNVDLSKVTHFSCALGDKPEIIRMAGGTHRRMEGRMRNAPCLTLDQFELADVDYIKIDVEGFERKVLRGGEHTIAACRPVIVIEQNEVTLPDENPLAAKAWLESQNYKHVATCPRGWDFVMVPREET